MNSKLEARRVEDGGGKREDEPKLGAENCSGVENEEAVAEETNKDEAVTGSEK